MSDKFHNQKIYSEGWVAGSRGQPKTANPYEGTDDEVMWNSGWDTANAGVDFDGYE